MSDENPIHPVLSIFARWPGLRPTSATRTDASSGPLLPRSYADEEWEVGWTDGRVGPESELTKPLLKFEARRRALERQEELSIKANAAEAEFANADEKHRALKADLDRVDASFRDVDETWLSSPGSFSRGLGVFYLAVAAILFLADIPLSLLAAEGLGISGDYRIAGNLAALRTGWQTLWEPISFAFGIAALGLFFKFIADFFFKPKYAKSKIMKALSSLLILAVLAVVGSNLFLLAKVRTSQKALGDATRLQALGQPVNVTQVGKELQSWAERSFICLTLTLPLLGGICASTGYSRVESHSRRRVLMKEREQARAAADAAFEQRTRAESAKKDAATRLRDAKELTEETGEAACAVHQLGFLRGFAVPETLYEGRPLHERVGVSVRRWLAIANQRCEFDGREPPSGPTPDEGKNA